VSANDWETVALGDVAKLDIDGVPVEADAEYRMAGLLIAGQGLFWRETISGRATAYPTFHRLHTDQLVMRKLTAWEGPITTVPSEYDGAFVSTEFPTFTLDQSRLLPEYMNLICQLPDFHAEMKMRSTGTAERRKRLNPDGLLAINVVLPPLPVQREAVAAVAAVDQAVAAYVVEHGAAQTLVRAARADALSSLELRPLVELLSDIEAGKSPKALDRAPAEGERGVLKVSAVRPGEFRPIESKAVFADATFPKHAAVRAGDVLISRANTRVLVGATCRVEHNFPDLYLSDKTLRLVVDDSVVDGDFLVHALASPVAREFIEANATGTSDSMKNISQKTILAIKVPYVEDVVEQRAIARRLDVVRGAAVHAARLAEDARVLRASVVDALTSGQLHVNASAGGIEELAPA
jgi:type I restriction enzyme S subunit